MGSVPPKLFPSPASFGQSSQNVAAQAQAPQQAPNQPLLSMGGQPSPTTQQTATQALLPQTPNQTLNQNPRIQLPNRAPGRIGRFQNY